MPTFCSQPTQQQLIAQTKPLGQEGTDQCGERTKTGIVRRMPAMRSVIDRESSQYAANYAAMRSAVERLRSELRRSTEGGGEKHVKRNKERGKLLPPHPMEILLPQTPSFTQIAPSS